MYSTLSASIPAITPQSSPSKKVRQLTDATRRVERVSLY